MSSHKPKVDSSALFVSPVAHPAAQRSICGRIWWCWLGLAVMGWGPTGFAQTPLYQWNFDAGTGANTGTGGGGTLTPATSGNGTAQFLVSGGISGRVGDGVLATANQQYNSGNAGIASTAAVDVLTDINALSQVTLTMWIKGDLALASQQFARLFMLGPTSTFDQTNPGFNLSLANGGVQYGVNGISTTSGVLALAPNDWNFVAVVYNGAATNPFFSPQMNTAVGTNNNSAFLLGGLTTSVSLAHSAGLATSGASPGALSLQPAAFAFLNNRSSFTRGFDGYTDDVRLYSGLLTTAQLEDIRLSAVPEPGAALMTMMGGLGLSLLLRRRSRS